MAEGTQPDRRRRRVAFLLPTLDIGGAERAAARIAVRLAPDRYEASVVAFARGSGLLADELRGTGVRVHHFGARLRRSPLVLVRLWRYLNRTRPDVLMTFMFHANVAGRIVGRLAWVPCVVSSLRIVGWESRFRILIDRATCHLADRLTTNSAAGVRFWARELRVPEERITLIYNGVDTDRFAPRSTHRVGSKVIGNLARLHRKNDHVTLLRALGSLAADTGENSWTCRIAGDGPEKAVLLELARRLGLTDRVQFVGHVDDPAGFLQDIDIYVQCSLAEGLSNSTLEAMACGLPVVATDVGGTSELVEQGKTGWLIPPREPDALAAALQRMLRDHDWCRGLGEEGRRIAKERFSVRRTVEATEALLDGLCAR